MLAYVQEQFPISSKPANSRVFGSGAQFVFQSKPFWTGWNSTRGIILPAWSRCHLLKETAHATL